MFSRVSKFSDGRRPVVLGEFRVFRITRNRDWNLRTSLDKKFLRK